MNKMFITIQSKRFFKQAIVGKDWRQTIAYLHNQKAYDNWYDKPVKYELADQVSICIISCLDRKENYNVNTTGQLLR